MNKPAVLAICPGRGTYNREELGYLKRHHGHQTELLKGFDAQRTERGQLPIRELDASETFTVGRFTRGDNASALIYACAYADFLSIDRSRYDVVAVTGNSMGWYIALACGGALDADSGFEVVNTMGTLMQTSLVGGQTIYPFVDDDWRPIPGRRAELMALIDRIDGLHLSIELGGMLVLAGESAALEEAERVLEPRDRFPMRLVNHSAFHTPLQSTVANEGQARLPPTMFQQPSTALVDGRGHTWWPQAVDLEALWGYTLQTQVTEPFDFTRAVKNALREFFPDVIVVLGPGRTLGGAVAQVLIAEGWRGLKSKQDFVERQAADPVLLAMGIGEQRAQVIGPHDGPL